MLRHTAGHTEQMAEPQRKRERDRERVTAAAGEEEECFSDHCNTFLENTNRCPAVRTPSVRADLTMDKRDTSAERARRHLH